MNRWSNKTLKICHKSKKFITIIQIYLWMLVDNAILNIMYLYNIIFISLNSCSPLDQPPMRLGMEGDICWKQCSHRLCNSRFCQLLPSSAQLLLQFGWSSRCQSAGLGLWIPECLLFQNSWKSKVRLFIHLFKRMITVIPFMTIIIFNAKSYYSFPEVSKIILRKWTLVSYF